MRKTILVLVSLVASLTMAQAGNKKFHPNAARMPNAARTAGRVERPRRPSNFGFGYYDEEAVDDPGYDNCHPDIVQVSNKALPNIIANLLIQGVAAYQCNGFDQSADNSEGPAPEREARCHSRVGTVDNDSEIDQRFVNYADWRTENPQARAMVVVPLPAAEPTRMSENFASTDTELPTRLEIAVAQSDDDQQAGQATLEWCSHNGRGSSPVMPVFAWTR